ncbi:MAG: hypothetical protein ACQERF_02365 [Actinomycetota bacterium]
MTTPPDGPTLHPALPVHETPDVVPPRSRVPAHAIGTLAGLAVAPLAVGGLLVGAGGLVGWTDGVVHGGGLFLLGALLFALWSILAGALSSLTMAVPALAWFVAAPLIAGPATLYNLTSAAPAGFADEVLWATDVLVMGRWWVVVAALLLGCAVAIHEARRSGRRSERAEAALATAPATPPPSRVPAHVGATAAATVLAVVAGWLTFLQLAAGATPALVGIAVAVGAAAALGGLSALAPFAAGAAGVITQLVVHAEFMAGGASRLSEAADPVSAALDAGAGWITWAMLLISFLGPWQARRVGRVLERAEIAVSP